jgi:hypothetical protein
MLMLPGGNEGWGLLGVTGHVIGVPVYWTVATKLEAPFGSHGASGRLGPCAGAC